MIQIVSTVTRVVILFYKRLEICSEKKNEGGCQQLLHQLEGGGTVVFLPGECHSCEECSRDASMFTSCSVLIVCQNLFARASYLTPLADDQ